MTLPVSSSDTLYLWQGTNRDGSRAQGELACSSLALARARLRQRGVRIRSIRRKASAPSHPGGRIASPDITLFSRQLATMLKSGIPLLQSFNIVAEGLSNRRMAQLVHTLRDDVASGSTLAEALRRQSRHFDDLFCHLIAAGELAGKLDTMLEQVATGREKAEMLRRKVGKALHYPLAVVMVAVAVTGILLVKVVPQFATTFASFGADLPAFTRLVLQLSDLAIAHWWKLPVLLVAGGLIGQQAMRRSPAAVALRDRLLLRLPLVGSMAAKSCHARFTRMLAMTYAAGLPLVDALGAAAGATGNAVYHAAIYTVRDKVSDGQQLHVAVRDTGLFPSLIVQMVAIGEESGTLDATPEKCAVRYESEVDNAMDGPTALLEPLIMAILGALIGGLMIAMYLPIFQLGQVI